MKKFLGLMLALFLTQSCTNNDSLITDASKGIFICDFEDLYFWNESGAVIKGQGRDESFCVKVDSQHEYSPAFKIKFGDIGVKKPKQIKVNGWFKLNELDASAKLIACIDHNGEILKWNASETKTVSRKAGVWTMIEAVTEIPVDVSPEAKLVVYAMWTGKGEVLFDDLEIRITE